VALHASLQKLRWEVDAGFAEELNGGHRYLCAIDQYWRNLEREFAGVLGHSDVDDEYRVRHWVTIQPTRHAVHGFIRLLIDRSRRWVAGGGIQHGGTTNGGDGDHSRGGIGLRGNRDFGLGQGHDFVVGKREADAGDTVTVMEPLYRSPEYRGGGWGEVCRQSHLGGW